VLANAGCVSCCDKSYKTAREHGPECDLPLPCRNQVYVFMIHGCTPTCDGGLETLRQRLAESGFAKVGVGEFASAPCIHCEIMKIHKCEPDAKFVLLGYDFGAAAAECLGRELSDKGVPIEGIVLLDPLACGQPCGGRRLLVTSGTTLSTAPYTDRLVVSDANHYKLPAHPRTAAAIIEMLKDIAARDCEDAGDPVPLWTYPHAPEMHTGSTAPIGPEWKFLADTTEIPEALNPRATSQQKPAPAPYGPPNAAGAVMGFRK
jgi:hypothetical protein